jgi:hypothetical protein
MIMAVLAGLLLATAAPSTPSGAAEPNVPAAAAVTATPSTGLVQGDTVTVAGTGFPANTSVAVIQCIPGTGVETCSYSTLTYVTTNGSGAFSTSFTPKRILVVGLTAYDCADPGQCRIGAGVPPDGAAGSAYTEIQFDPSVPPPPPPTITATPDTGLLDNDSVVVEGQGFGADEYVSLAQCSTPLTTLGSNCRYTQSSVQTSATGTFTVSVTVKRLVINQGDAVDCADPGACVLVALAGSPDEVATAPVTFDGSVPLPPPPTMTVTPDTGLVDGDTVTVEAEGFTPNSQVAVLQCDQTVSPNGAGCNTAAYKMVQTDGTGAISTDMTVDRLLYLQAGTVDCAVATCRMVVAELPYGYPNTSADLAFDPSVPPPGPPSLVADPSTGLADRQTVTLHGTGFPRNRSLGVAQCLTGDESPDGCDLQHYIFVTTDASGSFTASFTVYATYQTTRGLVDCREAAGKCRIGAGTSPGGVSGNASLSFAPAGSPTTTIDTQVQAAEQTAVTPNFTG